MHDDFPYYQAGFLWVLESSKAPVDIFGRLKDKTLLETERGRMFARVIREQVGGEQTSEK